MKVEKPKRVLIANRGEIAVRIAKALRELEMVSLGLFTDQLKDEYHLTYCDEWLYLAGKNNRETFLNIDKIIEIAKLNHVDAIHPGYGFLSENANFAEKVIENGFIFIGPNPKAIRSMGDKAISKIKAKEVGVPVVPGSVEEVKSINEAKVIAKDIGFPVLLKAVAGGGGKGMRICQNNADLDNYFESVKREALNSFNYDGLLIEKYIKDPHHIEVQIIADRLGNVFHCFERECSVQRRHQKIIEEAPSPFIATNEVLREKICQDAVKLAKAVGYDSMGTVEFIMGDDFSYYFLEMNTRIQVEHPITEEITSIDLLTLMIESAFGKAIPYKAQGEIKKNGHSIECRICAEDPVTMLPSPGIIYGPETTFPQGVRFDHAIYNGLEITSDFDPMIGKLIVRGETRKHCIRKMKAALRGLMIEGLKTNIPLHLKIFSEKNFQEGHYTTHYLQETKVNLDLNNNADLNNLVEKFVALDFINRNLV